MKTHKSGDVAAGILLIGLAIVLPIAAVLLGYWLLDVSLPTLMFISFLLLLIGSIECWPTPQPRRTSSEVAIFLILGLSSSVAVLLLFFIRLFQQGRLF